MRMWKSIWELCWYVFVPQWGRTRDSEKFDNDKTKELVINMNEIKVENLLTDFIGCVKQNIQVPKRTVAGKPLYYSRGGCHVNSILLCEDITSSNDYSCSIIEGIVVCNDGLAFEHYWNVIRDEENEPHYVDVTMDAVATDAEREMGKRYFVIRELRKEELEKKIANNEPLFSEETHKAIDDYYKEHPEQEAYYREGKKLVNRIE